MSDYIFLFDMDSTITRKEVLPEVSKRIGKLDEMRRLTEATMRGEIPFRTSFLNRVKILSDISVSEVNQVVSEIPLNPYIADFIENKMSADRAEQLFGEDWVNIIEQSTMAISDRFEERMLIYKNKFKRTEKGAITLGWKFELLNKNSGDLSGKMLLTEEQVIDVYAGSNLVDKRNAMVSGQVIENSGIADYILMDENVNSAQDVIDKMVPIKEYVKMHPDIYFACKALNYRTFAGKWDGDRPLSVQVYWNAEDNRLVPELVYDQPLTVKGNEVANRFLHYMKKLNIKTTDDIDDDNAGTDRII